MIKQRKNQIKYLTVLVVLLSFFANHVFANEHPALSDETGWDISLFLGYGKDPNPLVGTNQNQSITPYIDLQYSGEYFFVSEAAIGINVVEKPSYLLNAIVYPLEDSFYFFFNRFDYGDKLKGRDFSMSGGLEFVYFDRWGTINLQGLYDITNVHNGHVVNLSYTMPSIDRGFWRIDARVGLTHRSKELVNYYYGVSLAEASSRYPVYNGGDEVSSFVEVELNYQFTEYWQLKSFVICQNLSKQISDSPIVDKTDLVTYFIGIGHEW